jgi:hypothetical protein
MQVGAFYPYARNHNAGFNGDENFLHRASFKNQLTIK